MIERFVYSSLWTVAVGCLRAIGTRPIASKVFKGVAAVVILIIRVRYGFQSPGGIA